MRKTKNLNRFFYRFNRLISLILAVVCITSIIPMPSMAAAPQEPPSDSFVATEAAYTVTEHKYFKLYSQATMTPLSEGVLGLSSYGTLHSPMAMDGRGFTLEFLVEQSQEIELQLWESTLGAVPQATAKLGPIASGFCEGQWGDLADRETGAKPGAQWFEVPETGEELAVANSFAWDGAYWDGSGWTFPGMGTPEWEAGQRQFSFVIRFQPLDVE